MAAEMGDTGTAERGSGVPPSAAVREFNRFYTGVIGLLRGRYLRTPYSLTEARVIFEIAQRSHGPGRDGAGTDAAELRRTLDLDAGYLSRALARFETRGLISRNHSPTDARRRLIKLTAAGRAAFEMLDERAEAQARAMLSAFTEADKRRVVGAMAAIRQIIQRVPHGKQGAAATGAPGSAEGAVSARASIVLRAPLPGELGWVVQRNGAIYAHEYGWDETYEALVARIVADYAASHDPRRESAWIAEVDGEPVGCVFCVRDSDTVARLRLLLVEPHARGMGIGAGLVAECVRFATRAGYRELVLWTNDVLVQARRIYEKTGFEMTESGRHHSFGHDLVYQTWRLPLR